MGGSIGKLEVFESMIPAKLCSRGCKANALKIPKNNLLKQQDGVSPPHFGAIFRNSEIVNDGMEGSMGGGLVWRETFCSVVCLTVQPFGKIP